MIPQIEFATPHDAGEITDIYNYYVKHSTATFDITLQTQEQTIQQIQTLAPTYPYLTYRDSHTNKILAFAYAHPWKPKPVYTHTWESTIYTHPDNLGRHIGTSLYAELIAQCRARHCKTLIACITADNKNSIIFHEKFGFKKASHFKHVGIKFDTLLDIEDYQLLL